MVHQHRQTAGEVAEGVLNDTGLLTHLLGVDTERLTADPRLGGGIFENFVALKLIKQRGWSRIRPEIHHFRTHNGDEVDLILEDRAGRIVGVEVKASATTGAGHFKGLNALAEAAGDRFVRGIVVYTGPSGGAVCRQTACGAGDKNPGVSSPR